MKKLVLRRKKDGWLVVIRHLSATMRHFGFTQDPEKATDVTDQHRACLGGDIGERGRFELVSVKCTDVKS